MELQGWSCIFTPADGFDLVAVKGAKFLRIQVKTRRKRCRTEVSYAFKTATRHSKSHCLTLADADIIAVVALDIRKVCFLSVRDIVNTSISLRPEAFLENDMESSSWDEAVCRALGKSWNV